MPLQSLNGQLQQYKLLWGELMAQRTQGQTQWNFFVVRKYTKEFVKFI
ncbi:MAG: hypothetical protein RIS29_1497 [Bacteroidota bacterium]